MAEQRMAEARKHLYLAFDDWRSGYSIRQVKLPFRFGKHLLSYNYSGEEQLLSSDSGEEDYSGEEQLLSSDSGEEDSEQLALSSCPGKGVKPLPVFLRISAQRGFPRFFTSAFGTKIVAMHPRSIDEDGVPTIDVLDRTCTSEIQSNAPAFPIYFPVGDDSLFTLDIFTFEVLRKPKLSGQPWVWQTLTPPPFQVWEVSSYGVLPDGCILVSTQTDSTQTGTFIYDIKECVWKLYGSWVFPFTGRGHYDPSLKGFVGLSNLPETLGYLYCCTMPSTVTGYTGEALFPTKPQLKCTKKTVYSKHPAEGKHISATLVHIQPGKFCLVECVAIADYSTDEFMELPESDEVELMGGPPQGGRFIYRLKTFSLCIKKGYLKRINNEVRCYSLPHEARIGTIHVDPVAFWL